MVGLLTTRWLHVGTTARGGEQGLMAILIIVMSFCAKRERGFHTPVSEVHESAGERAPSVLRPCCGNECSPTSVRSGTRILAPALQPYPGPTVHSTGTYQQLYDLHNFIVLGT